MCVRPVCNTFLPRRAQMSTHILTPSHPPRCQRCNCTTRCVCATLSPRASESPSPSPSPVSSASVPSFTLRPLAYPTTTRFAAHPTAPRSPATDPRVSRGDSVVPEIRELARDRQRWGVERARRANFAYTMMRCSCSTCYFSSTIP
ncbi:hypothetical protein BV25DRAFT_1649502 [Artomyces pyxidatus]|uniref:Uncharacterized protein n=1 Tax=Artomyces pyxidatus TaxID=48021 RepID=A0ACB8SI07_9AGAM|nr:hypothetical protein BV25DRAFT_1649502 [Artomyces pyxidatus]